MTFLETQSYFHPTSCLLVLEYLNLGFFLLSFWAYLNPDLVFLPVGASGFHCSCPTHPRGEYQRYLPTMHTYVLF